MSDFILEATDIRKTFGKGDRAVKAVDGISVRIRRGKTLGILGESGSGKSTLGRCILRLIEPDGGTIKFDGKTVSGIPQSQFRPNRRNMQMIFQNPFSSLNPKMSIGEAIEDPMRIWKIGDKESRRKRVTELLDMVGINPRRSAAYPYEFSGGQQQRINIARALSLDPKFIVCDEAVSALDVSIQTQIVNLLMDLQKHLGLTYLFISHNLGVVEYLADDVLIMQHGKLVEYAPTEEIFKNPRSEYTRNLIASVPAMPTAAHLQAKEADRIARGKGLASARSAVAG
ncbi:MAG: peptide transporter ATP-binding protein [Fibrobacteres bacterium]|nr:peptide transporter ATP-binding protein [Fibrobacterota bacterium]